MLVILYAMDEMLLTTNRLRCKDCVCTAMRQKVKTSRLACLLVRNSKLQKTCAMTLLIRQSSVNWPGRVGQHLACGMTGYRRWDRA